MKHTVNKDNKNFNIENLKIIIGGLLIASFIWIGFDLYSFKKPLFFYITGISLFLIIAKFKLIDFISEVYYSLISKEFENILIITLVVLNFRKVHLNNLFYTLISFLTINILLFFLIKNLFSKKKILKKDDQTNLLSFRKKELAHLKKLVSDPLVSTILIDDKIGNGKTFLLETFLENEKDNLEVIYLKLPLIENQDILIQIVVNEIYKILRKNKVYLKKQDIFFKYLSNFKIANFEFKNNYNQTNWESIEKLKKGINDSNKQILIILDDIEREDDYRKIKNSVSFLGEFSEYLRNTPTTFLFVAQQDKINKLRNLNEININGNLYAEEFNFFEKYFNQVIKLSPLIFKKIKFEDLELLINQSLKLLFNERTKDKDEEFIRETKLNISQHTTFILELLKILDEKSLKLKTPIGNERFRVLTMFLTYFKESILAEDLNNNSSLVWMYIYKSFELFFNNLSIETINSNKIDDEIYKKLEVNLNEKINFLSLSYSIKNKIATQTIYEKGGLREENNFLNIENILNYLKNGDNKIKENIKINLDHNTSYILFQYINSENISRFLNLKLEFNYSISQQFIELINKIGTFNILSNNDIEIYFNYLAKEIKNKTFYSLFYQNNHFDDGNNIIYENDLLDENKIKTLQNFKNIILQNIEQIKNAVNIEPILKLIDDHIKTPSLNSENINDYK